ncbi:B3 domain-containing protein REM9-like [Diospyros lotus]|uniref:B3 domain-containing protein REM9-like n=1 Tax=Diospyros lotus TaxID=55363 RepID=UPI0022586F8E|nr:B3 domain-containing protein REM9-like [Diospyros lotus]
MEGRYLESGWTDFVNHHELNVGVLLVFRHEGDLVFDVMVFDPNGCERAYQPLHVKDEVDDSKDSQESPEPIKDETRSEEIVNSPLHAHPRSVKSSSTGTYPYFVATLKCYTFLSHRLHIPVQFARLHGLCYRNCEMIIMDNEQRSWQVSLGHNYYGRIYIGKGWKVFCAAKYLKEGETIRFELIENGKKPVMVFHRSENGPKMAHPKVGSPVKCGPQCFTATLTRALLKFGQLHMPMNFTRLNGLSKYSEMTIVDPKRRKWTVSLRKSNSNCAGRIFIGKGWSGLVKANGIKGGDVIKLEIIKAGRALMMNFRIQSDPKSAGIPTLLSMAASSSSSSRARIPPAKPQFFQPLLPGFHNGLSIPLSFLKHLSTVANCGCAWLRTSLGKWEVTFNGRSFGSAGWTDFVNRHDLNVGDFLIFRHEGDLVFDVMAFDPSACEKEFQPLTIKNEPNKSSSHCQGNSEPADDSTRSTEGTKRTKGSSVDCVTLYFIANVTKSQLRNGELCVPKSFARMNGMSKKSRVTIIDERQRQWTLSLKRYEVWDRVYISKGWRSLAITNELKVGDAIKLEIIQGGKPLMMNFSVHSRSV